MAQHQYDASADDRLTSTTQAQALLWRMRAETERLVAEAGPTGLDLPGAAGYWTIRDVIAHLTAWRWWSVARLEGAARDEEPTPPWAEGLNEDEDVDRINQQFYDEVRDRAIGDVLRDSRASFDRLEAALLALPETDLVAPGRYPWLGGYPAIAIVTGSAEHLFVDHLAGIVAALARSERHRSAA